MADSLNIKNPSVRQGDLDLRTDASGNIVSISGHPIAGGGGGGGTTYYGDNEYIQIKNGTVNTFTVTDKVKDVVDNLTEKIALQIDAQTYNKNAIDTKLSAKQDELVFEGYEDKIETINGSGFIVNGYVSDFAYNIDKNNFNKKIDYLSASVSGKEDKLTFEYDEDNKVSAINGSALAGQGGTTYTPGQYINIDSNNEISVTGVVASDEYATYSGDWNDVSNSYKTNSGSFLTNEDLTQYSTIEHANDASANAFNQATALIPTNYITKDVDNLTNYYKKTQTSSDSELAEAFGSILKYDVTAAAGIQVTTATDAGVKTYGISMTAQPVVTDTRLSGYNGIAAEPDGNVSGLWDVGLTQDMLNTINGKLDSTEAAQTYLEKSTYSNASGKWENASNEVATNSAIWNAKVDQNDLDDYYKKTDTSSKDELSTEFAKYQVTGDYVTESDISDMATKTWVGEQGFYTKASGDNDYAPKSVTATINTLTGASAGWNEVTAKLDKSIYSNASGNWENTYNVVRQYSAAGTWLTAHQSLTNYYTKNETSGASELSDEFAKYVTSSNVTTQDTDYVMTTTGWKVLTLPGGGMTQVIHDETLTGQGNANDNKLSVAWSALSGNTIYSAKSAESARYTKQLKDASKTIQISDVTALQNWASSNSSTWDEVSAKLGTAQYATDSATFVTSSNSTITGTKQYALTTAGWAEVQAGTSFTGVVTGIGVSGTGLSNSPLGINTTNMNADRHYSFTINGWSETDTWLMNRFQFENGVSGVPDMTNYKMRIGLSGNYLPTSGGTVSGDVIVKSTGSNLLAVNTTATLMGQSRVNSLTDTTAIGTNWLGVNSNGGGFLKNVQGGNVGALNGTSIQIDFAPNGNTAYGNITVNSQGNESKVVHVPTASYNSMSSFDNTNGPNYMLRKTASGFDIGAAVINVTSLPQQTEANAYYFVYDV